MSYIASTALSTKPIPVTRLSRIFDIVQCDCTIPLQKQKGHQVFKTCLPYMDEGTHGSLVWAHSGQPMHLTGSHSLAAIHFYPGLIGVPAEPLLCSHTSHKLNQRKVLRAHTSMHIVRISLQHQARRYLSGGEMYAHPPARVGSAPPYPYPAHATDASTPTDRSLSPDLSAMFDKGFLKTPRAAARSPRPKRRARPVQVDHTASALRAEFCCVQALNSMRCACWLLSFYHIIVCLFCVSVVFLHCLSTLPAYASAIFSGDIHFPCYLHDCLPLFWQEPPAWDKSHKGPVVRGGAGLQRGDRGVNQQESLQELKQRFMARLQQVGNPFKPLKSMAPAVCLLFVTHAAFRHSCCV